MSPAPFSGNRYVGALENQSKEVTYGILDEDQYRQRLKELQSIK